MSRMARHARAVGIVVFMAASHCISRLADDAAGDPGNCVNKIKQMPDATKAQKRKKDDWEAARVNLHHVGSVWRNNTMHPAASYTQSEGRDVFNATRGAAGPSD
jgi:hypothetical protein